MGRVKAAGARARAGLVLCAAGLGLLAAAPVAARTARGGGTVRAVRQHAAPQVDWMISESRSGESVTLLGLSAAPPVGARYSLIDGQGFIGDVRVTSVRTEEMDTGRCKLRIQRVHAVPEGSARPDADRGEVFALGPVTASLRRARLLEPRELGADLPADRKDCRILGGADADGDNRVDVLVTGCPGDRPASLETWTRDRTAWHLLHTGCL